jgi:thiamine-phosphate pyrophosphorylase
MAVGCLLYYITDRNQFSGDETFRRRQLLAKIAEAARAHVDYIQLREKDLSARDLQHLAEEAFRTIRDRRGENGEPRTRLLINSRTDIALAIGADGVHLRSDDVAPPEVRNAWMQVLAGSVQLVVSNPLIAVSCHSQADVLRAQSQAADFAVFGPVFGKKDGSEPAGLAALQEACRSNIPVLALGGVTLGNAGSCLKAGAAGVAAIRLFQENRIKDVVRALGAL